MNFYKVMMVASGAFLVAAGGTAILSGIQNQKISVQKSAQIAHETSTSDFLAIPASNANSEISNLAQAFGFSDPHELETAQKLRVLFTTAAYGKALTLIEENLGNPAISLSFRSWLGFQLPVVLASDGWAAIATGDCDKAIDSLRRAALLAKDLNAPGTMQADIRRGLGFCLKKIGQPGGAEENLHEAIKANAGDQESRLLLADLYETDGRFSEAVQTLEEGSPSGEVAKRLEVMRRRAGEGDLQQIQRTPHFTISYRTGEHEALAAEAAQILEGSLDEFVEKYGYKEPATPLEVILYPTEKFSWVLGGVPDWAEGIFDGRMRIPIRSRAGGGTGIISQVLRHELIHALNSNMTGGRALPPWLEEGLAHRIGEMPLGGAFPFPIKPAPFSPAADFGASYMTFGAAAAGSIYRQSLYLVMTLENMESDALRRVISGLSPNLGASGDAVLTPVGGNFARLHEVAAGWWKERRALAAR